MKDEQKQDKTDEPDIADVSPTQQVSLVIDDVRTLVRAELHYYQSRLDYSRHVMRISFRFGAVGVLLGLLSLAGREALISATRGAANKALPHGVFHFHLGLDAPAEVDCQQVARAGGASGA